MISPCVCGVLGIFGLLLLFPLSYSLSLFWLCLGVCVWIHRVLCFSLSLPFFGVVCGVVAGLSWVAHDFGTVCLLSFSCLFQANGSLLCLFGWFFDINFFEECFFFFFTSVCVCSKWNFEHFWNLKFWRSLKIYGICRKFIFETVGEFL